ncbi:membrane protein [Terrihabitans soli]|uniref:Membrane protein n=1 Tax=Terrihabitans soli TaxID=708113 RepID=A0A6S6QV33_9HYPH|nr:DMT family transporter [Terrihabitans soli]BCJ91435.1 membrane protein [Terrihabitans soli]
MNRLFSASAPLLFVVLWSSGFIVARLVAPYADPLTFTSVRFVVVIALLTVIAVLSRAPWPSSPRAIGANAVSGILLHGLYLGGVFWAVKHGLPAGIAGLFAGLQPLVTAMVAKPLLGEDVGLRRWIGILLGFSGTALVLEPKIGAVEGAIPGIALAVAALAVAGFTFGTIWQKRTGEKMDLRTGNVVQFSAALIPVGILALLTENLRLDPVPELFAGLAWSVLGMSIGAITLLLLLIKRGEVVQTASLLYLVPPVTALMAWIGFGEALNLIQLIGMGVAAFGVALTTRQ